MRLRGRMAKVPAAAQRALSIVAHASMAMQLDKDVFAKQNAGGFYEFWKKSLAAAELAILDEFGRLQRKVYADMAKMLEKDVDRRKAVDGGSVLRSDEAVQHAKFKFSLQPFHKDQVIPLRSGDVEALLQVLKGDDALAGNVQRDGVPVAQGVEQGADLGENVIGYSRGLPCVADDLVHESAPRSPASDLARGERNDVVHGDDLQ